MNALPVSLDLMEFIERDILPRYNAFGASHGLRHVTHVIHSSLQLAQQLGANADMAYAIAAYHDLGLEGPRAIHHITSGKILLADQRLRRWFTADQIAIMRQAVEDHRASSSRAPRSIYGKIVAEADRELEPEEVFRRTVEYGLEQNPTAPREVHWQRFRSHISEKYGPEGYIRLWIPGSPNERKLANIRHIIETDGLLRQEFDRCWAKVGRQ